MKDYSIKLYNQTQTVDEVRIKSEIRKLYGVKAIEVDSEHKEVRLKAEEEDCLNSCRTILANLGCKLVPDRAPSVVFGKNKARQRKV